MALGRLQAALTSATSEVTIAAANLNFDFTLVKYEAPKEYQLLGGVLSTKRKENAEHGSSHILARQLGALFKDVCPATPRLLEAYGKRVSEIAKASKTASDTYTDTLFGDYTGIDGTSIWAAATSSESALYVHLLATLLARIWTAPEATAVWVELVSERRKDIARRVDEGEPVNFSLAAAVGQEIHRSQLAAWDASARSWLRTADGVFKHKQKQLELILKNVNHAVSDDSRVFSSVIKTWQTAVETMNKLISGMPQAVENSASLLGLAAWHIYPDMSVFSPEVVEVKMDDSLVATGGFLSIGLATRPRTSNEKNGVYWSLSLAQLRFYGKPVKVERALETGTRITFSQLDLVIFGVMLAEWRTSDSQGQLVAEVIISLVDYVTSVPQGSSDDKRLLKMLRDSATAYSGRSTGDESLNSKLIQLGRRRAEGFIHDEGGVLSKHGSSSFLFNMLDPVQFMSAFKDSDGQISFLRHLASSSEISKMPPDASIIRYAPFSLHHTHPDQDARVTTDAVTATTPLVGSLRNSYVDTDSNGDVGRDATSVSVLDDEVDMEDLEQEESPLANFPRDSYFDTDSDDESDLDAAGASSSDNGVFMEIIGHPNFRPSDFSYATAVPTPVGRGLGSDVLTHHRWLSGHFHDHVLPVENKTYDAEDKFRSWPEEIQITAAENPGKYVYHLAIGDPMQAALFLRRQEFEQSWDDTLTLHHLLWCIEHDLLHPAALLKVLCHSYHAKKDQLLKTLKALSVVAKLYDNLPDTLVDVGVLDRTLTERRWARDMLDDTGRERAATHRTYFSMISYFESGIHDVDPSQLENVIALSSADSLFVCRPLLEDPYKLKIGTTNISRILGNIGKPGITFLLPPQEPMTRDLDPSSWRLDAYRPFDGTKLRSFGNTSLHLSFTDYHVPIFDGSRGAHDNQVSFIESVISVRDKGEWVADVDPLPLVSWVSRTVPHLRKLPAQRTCQHPKDSNANQDIIAVDSWDELLDKPDGIFVVRTGDNWVARLALTLVAYQRFQQTTTTFAVTVCPPDVCWTCTQQSFQHHAFIY